MQNIKTMYLYSKIVMIVLGHGVEWPSIFCNMSHV